MRFTTSHEDCKEQIRRFRSSPHLLPHITSIILEQQSSIKRPWELDDAKELGKLLSQVQNLSIKNWSSRSSSREDWIATMNGIITFLGHIGTETSNLNMISIRTMDCAVPQELFQILSKVSGRPRELRLDLVGDFDENVQLIASQDDDCRSSVPAQPGWPLRSLTLNTTELRPDVFRWLLSKAVDLSHLERLTLVRYFAGVADDIPVAPDILWAMGSSLRELRLACRFEIPPSEFSRFSILEQLTHHSISVTHFHEILEELPVLEKLVVGSDYYGERSLGFRRGLSFCTEMIRPLQRHESLQEIIIAVDIRLGTSEDIDRLVTIPIDSSPDMEVLDTRLANPSYFPKFKCFHFIAEMMWSALGRSNNPWKSTTPLCDIVRTHIREALPQLNGKGALVVNAEEMSFRHHMWDGENESPRVKGILTRRFLSMMMFGERIILLPGDF
ncbi:hypothetical protein PQX77_013832 [Marasmius sp. AFHP31]|nr:hypothetical protein PQX77_013832 [Marasmius sp. AFHP31]